MAGPRLDIVGAVDDRIDGKARSASATVCMVTSRSECVQEGALRHKGNYENRNDTSDHSIIILRISS